VARSDNNYIFSSMITKENKSRLERLKILLEHYRERGANKEWLNTAYRIEVLKKC
jgi:hypothetical protein